MKELQRIIHNINNAGIETKPFPLIELDALTYGRVNITIIDNSVFELFYGKESQEITFRTKFAYRMITEKFLSEAMEIQDIIPLLREALYRYTNRLGA